ncbi:MAG: T9SS C-terminal target domain-containing protein [Chitinophagia bacterium]|nr:T9SS C-terminal target domain-containing protein [Chitinophagia bacterium]
MTMQYDVKAAHLNVTGIAVNGRTRLKGMFYTSGTSAGTDTLIYTLSNLCGSAATRAAITVNPLPVAGTISGTTTLCAGASSAFTATVTGGSWSHTAPSVASLSGSAVYGLAAGTDTLLYTATNGCGSATTSTIINVNTAPAAAVISVPAAVCNGSSVGLAASVSGGTWSASTHSTGLVTLSGSTATGSRAGLDTVFYTISNTCGNTSSFTTIQIDTPVSAGVITGSGTVCAGSFTPLSASVRGGTWSVSSITAASVSLTGNVYGVAAGMDTIYYSVSNSCGSYSNYHVVTVNAGPAMATLSGPSAVCAGSTISLSPSVTGGVWSRSNLAASVVGGTVTGVNPGVDTIYYSLSNTCGTARSSAAITVNAAPDAGSVSGASFLCVGSTDTVFSTRSGGAWTSSNPSLATVARSTGIVTGISSGIDTVYYSVSNSCGTDIAATYINVSPLPYAGTISGSDSVCAGASTMLSDSVTGGTWYAISSVLSVRTGTVFGISPGSDTVMYGVTNSCGTANATHIMSVLPAPSAGSITGSTTLCVGSATTLSVSATGGNWTNAHAAIATVAGGAVTGLSAGRDTIYYTVTNSCGTARAQTGITINALPDAGIIFGDTTLCVGATGHLTATVAGGTWSGVIGSAIVVSGSGAVIGVRGGTATVYYNITNSCGTDSALWTVTVIPTPVAGAITGADTLCIGDSTTLSETVTGGSWYSGDSTVARINATGLAVAIGTGATEIYYAVANNCDTASATHHLYVKPSGECLLTTNNPFVTPGSITLYPNPTSGRISIVATRSIFIRKLVLTDVTGRAVLTNEATSVVSTLDSDLSQLAAGVYLYRIYASDGVHTGKVVLE